MVKVSVIVPVYNGEEFIESCIKNILNQTLKEIELILVNDGSKDNTLNICKKYADFDNRIVLINQENQGVSLARNKGIDISKGNYLCFIDCDDRIDNDYLEKLYKIANEKNVQVVCCDIECIDLNGKFISKKTMQSGYYSKEIALNKLFEFKDLNWGPCGKLFSSDLIKNKVEFPNLHVYEDLVFVYKCIFNTKQIFYTNKCSYYYIHRENNGAMKKFIKSPTLDIIKVADETILFLKKEMPSIFDSSFYGLISQVIMYINDINKIDPQWDKKESKLYLEETKKLLARYRFDLIKNKTIYYKEKILFLMLSFSTILYKKLSG